MCGFFNWMVLLWFLSILSKVFGWARALLLSGCSFAYVIATCSLYLCSALSAELSTDIHWCSSFVICGIRLQFVFRRHRDIRSIFRYVSKCRRPLWPDASVSTLALTRCEFFQIWNIRLILVLSGWTRVFHLFLVLVWIWFLRTWILVWPNWSLALIS